MPRVSDFAVLYKGEQPTLSVRARTKVENMPAVIGEAYGKMAAYLQEQGEYPADIPCVAYFNMDMQDLDVEMSFPVAKVLSGQGDIKASSIPEGKRVFCMYRGAYTDMESVYAEMAQWIEDNGLTPTGTAYEHYFNGPGFPESEMLTMIVMPVL